MTHLKKCSQSGRQSINPRLRPPLLVATLGFSLLSGVMPIAARASDAVNQAKLLRFVDGNEVFINNQPARVRQIAPNGSSVSTRKSRAELLFNSRAIGLMGRKSAIRVGSRCFTLDAGTVVINGTQRACLGSKVLGIKGTTYVLSKELNDTYTLSVLAGEGVVADDLPIDPDTFNILSRYPKVNPYVSAVAGGYGTVYPSGSGSFTGGLTYFTPIKEVGARNMFYSSTSVGTGFQDIWGVSTEVGYRLFTPSNRSISSLYVGYSGYGSPGCFSNLVNGGLQWEKARWRLGASGGLKLNNCYAGLNYGALNLSVPVVQMNDRPVYFSVSPYVLAGNVAGTSLLTSAGTSYSPGLRVSVEVPFNQRLSLRSFIGADSVFGVNIGAYFNFRLPTAGRIVRDPNITQASFPSNETLAPTAIPGLGMPQSNLPASEVARIALAGMAPVVSDVKVNGLNLPDPSLNAEAISNTSIGAGQRAHFTSAGEMISIERISNNELLNLLRVNFKGQNPLPESRRIAQEARKRGVATAEVAGILGTDFIANASLPVSATVDTPFSPSTQVPVARYVCAATQQARTLGAQNAANGQFNYSGGAVYFGRGSKTSQGYPATYNKSEAYVFANANVCNEINRLTGQSYNVVVPEQL